MLPYANRQKPRQNVIAAWIPYGAQRGLWWRIVQMKIRTPQVAVSLEELTERLEGRLVVVMDNASFHKSKEMRAHVATLERRGLTVYYLPPYSPKLNPIERVFGDIKHHRMPERSYDTPDKLSTAIHAAFADAEADLLNKPLHHPP